jgi:hypothetical protein
LKRAIAFAGGNHQKVFVLSIPDWGITPFAKERILKKLLKRSMITITPAGR